MTVQIVVGLGFGDEGKGATVDALAKELIEQGEPKPLVIRFSGGPQAAHNVYSDAGAHHTFSQFGSATLRGCFTLLSQHMLVAPERILQEAAHLDSLEFGYSSLKLLAVDERAPLVTRFHGEVNRARERARGDSRHGSCGLGVGETERYRLLEPEYPVMGDMSKPEVLRAKLAKLEQWAINEVGPLEVTLDDVFDELCAIEESRKITVLPPAIINSVLASEKHLIFEGSQGVLLDERVGFHPYTTWSTITPDNAYAVLAEAGVTEKPVIVGVTRTYQTRHGAGPFPTEGLGFGGEELHNGYGEFQGSWRVGALDLTLLYYSANVLKPDVLSITHLDVEQTHVGIRYDAQFDFAEFVAKKLDKDYQEGFTQELGKVSSMYSPVSGNEEVIKLIETIAKAPARLLSYGPKPEDRVFVKPPEGPAS